MKKKKGGKTGNKNAVKHGIYAKFITVIDDEALEGMKDNVLADEIALARVRLVDAINKHDAATDDEIRLRWDAACRDWLDKISAMIARNVEKREQESAVFETIIEAIRAANDKQKVK